MEKEKIIKILSQNSRILNHLTDDNITEVLKCCKSQVLKDKEIVFREESSGTDMFIIVSGSIMIKKGSKTIDLIRMGECFGEMGAISGEKRSATAEASGDILLLVLSLDKINEIDPYIQIKMMKNIVSIISERLRKRTEEVIH